LICGAQYFVVVLWSNCGIAGEHLLISAFVNPATVTSPFGITSHNLRNATQGQIHEPLQSSKSTSQLPSHIPNFKYYKFKNRVEDMGSSLPCKYGPQSLGYSASYPLCHFPLCSSTRNSYADETCAFRCC
jgi:hypothetical protein